MDIDFSMTDTTADIDFGDPDPEPLPADIAAKDAAWKALEQAVDEWIEANPDPQGKIKLSRRAVFDSPSTGVGARTDSGQYDSRQRPPRDNRRQDRPRGHPQRKSFERRQ